MVNCLEVLRAGLFSEVIVLYGVISWGRVTWSLFRGWLLLEELIECIYYVAAVA